MTRCTNRRTAILTLILGLTLLLCGCQVGGGVFVLPDISTKDSTQSKTQLLAALNKHYYTHFDNRDSSHFIYGNDSAAEAVLSYLQKVCADDASKVASLLSDSTGDTSPVHCADGLLASYPSLSARPCKVSYAALDSDLSDDALLSSAAQMILKNRRFLVLPSDISSSTDCCQVSFAVGTIGGQTFVIAVFTS